MWNLTVRSTTMPTVERLVAAPPEVVWDVITDLSAWPQWGPTVQRARLDTGAPEGALALGSAGRIWVLGGVALPFTITEYEPGHCWSWAVGGVPATKHYVRTHPGGAVVSFAVPVWAPPYLAVCAWALSRVDRLARARL